MSDLQAACAVRQKTVDQGVPALILENELISATVLPGKGADIYD